MVETAVSDNLGVTRDMITNSRLKTVDGPDAAGKFQFPTIEDVYGMNWPYDYFSLIEKVKIEAQYLF